MIQFANGQNDFSEKELDGIYIGLRQGVYWEQKAKEQEKALRLFDSLTRGMRLRLEIASEKEANYISIIENKDANLQAQKNIGDLKLKEVRKNSRTWVIIVAVLAFGTGVMIAK